MDIDTFKQTFDPVLFAFLEEKLRQAKQTAVSARVYRFLEHGGKLLRAGGKRIRPYGAYTMYQTAGGQDEQLCLEALVYLEFFHLFALIHDDIIDRGAERHGTPTIHMLAGDAQAMLAGDLFFHWSQQAPQAVQPIFQQMVEEVIIGEMLDVDSLHRTEVSESEILYKMELKTARYTFVRPLQMGAALAGKGEKYAEFCQAFGTALGLAYQIQDDLFDLTGTLAHGGKSVLRDLGSGQPTLFTAYIFSQGTSQEKKELAGYFGTGKTAPPDKVSRLFQKSGALAEGERAMEHYFTEAEHVLANAPFSNKKPWEDLCHFLKTRSR